MYKKKLSVVLVIIMIAVVAFSGCSKSDNNSASSEGGDPGKVYTIKVSTADAEGSAYDLGILQPMKKMLDEKSNGQLQLEIYYSASLSKQGETLNDIRSGVLEMGADVLTFYPGEYMYTELFGTPGINVGGLKEVSEVFNEYAKEFPEQGLEDFVIMVRWASGTFCYIDAKDPVSKVADLKGKTLRATPNFIPWYAEMGASGTFMPITEVYEGLKLNVIDGAHATIQGTYTFSLQEVTNTMTTLPMVNGDQLIALSRSYYDSLPADLQKVIDEVQAEMLPIAIDAWVKDEENAKKIILEGNPDFQFIEISDADMPGFMDAANGLLEAKAKELNDAGLDGTGALAWLRERSK